MTEQKRHFHIYFHKKLSKFMVNIRFNKTNYHIGYYTSIDDAIIARNEALVKLYGEGGLSIALSADKLLLEGKKVAKAARILKFDTLIKNLHKPADEDKKLTDVAEKLKERQKSLEDII